MLVYQLYKSDIYLPSCHILCKLFSVGINWIANFEMAALKNLKIWNYLVIADNRSVIWVFKFWLGFF